MHQKNSKIMEKINQKNWWRNTNERNIDLKDRKISWLELFYDLVYVIAISKVTHHLALHLDVAGFLDYFYLVALIYWGWLNGSWHHDMLGANDVRTIFLTIWQMVIIAALIVTFSSETDKLYFNATIVILIMQFYITYLWWSEGIYDENNKEIRQYYIGFYLSAFALIFSTFFLQQPYLRIVFYATLILNFIPPYFVKKIIDKEMKEDYQLSASMTERLGLFTIILFGEVILGVINGVSSFVNLNANQWILFVISIFIVFTLWYIFFKTIGDRRVKKGYVTSNVYTVAFLLLAMSLGIMGVAFSKLFLDNNIALLNEILNMKQLLGVSICVFLLTTLYISTLVETPKIYINIQPKLQKLLFGVIISISVVSVLSQYLQLFEFLTIFLAILLVLPITILNNWNNLELKKME